MARIEREMEGCQPAAAVAGATGSANGTGGRHDRRKEEIVLRADLPTRREDIEVTVQDGT
jgi:hypothetical protein